VYKKLLLLAALGLFASCKKFSNPKSETPVPETIKEMNIAVTGLNAVSSAPVQQGIGNFNFIGYGYNVIGKYADTSSVKGQVINISAYDAAYSRDILVNNAAVGTFNPLFAENAEDYSSQISRRLEETKGLNVFTNTITMAFPGKDAITDKYIYAQYVYTVQRILIQAYLNSRVKDYLTPGFSKDVQNLTSENLVKKYGTHVLSGIALGAKFNIYFQAKSSDSNKLRSATVGFTYVLKQVFGVMSGHLNSLNPFEVNAISEPKIVYEAIGGDPSRVTKTVTDKGTHVGFNDWISTCTEDKMVFIDIQPRGLVPLYDLIADPVKKAEVKSHITSYIEKNQIRM